MQRSAIRSDGPAGLSEEVARPTHLVRQARRVSLRRKAVQKGSAKTGLSQVTLLYEDGTDQMRVRQLVTERLNGVRDQWPRR